MGEASGMDFAAEFERLSGHPPLRWQRRLFSEWLLAGRCPGALDLPTGLGKTSVMVIWYLAVRAVAKVPRRLVYVVDRRAVVDQATTVAEEIRQREAAAGRSLQVSTLRGQYADNRAWLADPAAAAIIVGTIDMIGSRLLFSGYGVSRRMRPYHAGLLGVDSLVVLDEAHLSRPFCTLLRSISEDPDRTLGPPDASDRAVLPSPRFLAMSATGPEEPGLGGGIFRLSSADAGDPIVTERLAAKKRLSLRVLESEKALTERLATRAMALSAGAASKGVARVLVYCDRRQVAVDVKKAIERLARRGKVVVHTQLLVGERRVYEREALFDWLGEHGFVGSPPGDPPAPSFLVATSAGEVGVDLDAHHLVCDLVEWERMVQRLGRVNRRGHRVAEVEVLAAPRRGEREGQWGQRLARLRAPLDALRAYPDSHEIGGQVHALLPGEDGRATEAQVRDASPGAIGALAERARGDAALHQALLNATVSPPLAPALTRALADAWALSSLEEHAGRPEVEPWLRGWEPDDVPQARVIWRRWLPWPAEAASPVAADVERFFAAARPHLIETLEAAAFRVAEVLSRRAERCLRGRSEARPGAWRALDGTSPAAIVLRSDGRFDRGLTVAELATLARDRAARGSLGGCTVVGSAALGGLSPDGMLDPDSGEPPATADSVGGEALLERVGYRVAGAGEAAPEAGDWKLDTAVLLGEAAGVDGEDSDALRVFVARGRAAGGEGDPAIGRRPQSLRAHQEMVAAAAREIADALGLPEPYGAMLVGAARVHDLGKAWALWQNAMGAPGEGRPYAKTAGGDGRRLNGYRHEFGSLGALEDGAALRDLPEDLQELVRHLVAAHHGHSRPAILPFDPAASPGACDQRAREVALRFARLQRRWGPWGLAWWESLLRAADQRASRRHDEGAA